MKTQLLSTWKMSQKAMEKVWPLLRHPEIKKGSAETNHPRETLGDLVEAVIRQVEDDTSLSSVGSGGLPGKTGIQELDAAYMEASDLRVGAVLSLRTVKNPITLARYLSHRDRNCILTSRGAEALAKELRMEELPPLSPGALQLWERACKEQTEQDAYAEQTQGERRKAKQENPGALDLQSAKEEQKKDKSHDTVCVLGRWEEELVVGVSTSGLFMKEEGRVGDAPLVGSGFYARKGVGTAGATGLGEDILRGCLSYEIVRLMEEGLLPQQACEKALLSLEDQLGNKKTSISVIALNATGEIGAATTMEIFPFVYMDEEVRAKLMMVRREGTVFCVQEADEIFYNNYVGD